VSRTRFGLLIAGLLSSGVLAPASASARVDKAGATSLCGEKPCSIHQLRVKVKKLQLKALRLRDQRGLLNVRIRRARLTHSRVQLAHEATHWILARDKIKRKKPLWRTLRRWDAWMCIHAHEGAWTDPNAPYHGGLQMDAGFMRTYGSDLLRRYGTADHWPPAAQVAVAERAYRTRGFHPWPNTARACGVL
jgi:hypothetical protein